MQAGSRPGGRLPFSLLRQRKGSKRKASRSQGRCAVPCAARTRRVWRKLGFASNMRQPDPPDAAPLSPVTTALGTELRLLGFAIANSRDCKQPNSPAREGPSASKATRDTPQSACKVSAANEHAVPGPRSPAMETVPSSAAAGGSGLALFERCVFRQTPPDASSAGNPQGTVSGSPFLWVLSFGEAKESTSAAGPKPGSPRTK